MLKLFDRQPDELAQNRSDKIVLPRWRNNFASETL